MKLLSFSLFLISLFSLSFSASNENDKSASDNTNTTLVTDDSLIIEDDSDILGQKDETASDGKTNTNSKEEKKAVSQVVEKIIESDEELILDDGEEYLIAPSKPEIQNSTGLKSTDSSSIVDTAKNTVVKNDSSNQVKPVNVLPKPEHVVVTVKPAKIENLQSINFAHNLKQYRSPKLAMLYSFILPGAGQFYARNKLKGSIFATVEAAIIGTGIGLYAKGKKDMDKAREFADKNYSAETFRVYYDSIFRPSVPDSLKNAIFVDPSAEEFLQMAKNKDDDFYDYIQGNDMPFVRGWNDVTPTFLPGLLIQGNDYKSYHADTAFLVYPAGGDSTQARFGYSKLQGDFESKYSDANNILDISQKIFFLLILDRIVSAVDAGITAKAYNDEMLGKQSFWKNINIHEKQVCSGADTYHGYALEVRF